MAEKREICQGCYAEVIKRLSEEGIAAGAGFRKYRTSAKKFCFTCIDSECECKMEVVRQNPVDDYYILLQIGEHCTHSAKTKPKPRKEHLSAEITSHDWAENRSNIRQRLEKSMGCRLSRGKVSRATAIVEDQNATTLWRLLPALIDFLSENDIVVDIDRSESGAISEIYIEMPFAKKWVHSLAFTRITFLDGCHCNNFTKSTLLAMVTVTADHVILPLGLSISNSGECNLGYTFFGDKLSEMFPNPCNFTILSDEHPSIPRVTNAIPGAKQRPCAYHLAQKLKAPAGAFYSLIQADHPRIFSARKESWEQNYTSSFGKIKDKLDDIAFMGDNFPGNFGYIADSPVESFNNAVLEIRGTEPTVMICDLLEWAQHQVNHQLELLDGVSGIYCQRTAAIISARQKAATALAVREKGRGYEVQQTQPEGDVFYRVSCEDGVLICQCKEWDRTGIACVHEYAVQAGRPGVHVREPKAFHKREVIRAQLTDIHWPDPNLNTMLEDNEVEIPDRQRQRGRPRKHRFRPIRETALQKELRHCSKCGRVGHNKRKCPGTERRSRSQVHRRSVRGNEVAEVRMVRSTLTRGRSVDSGGTRTSTDATLKRCARATKQQPAVAKGNETRSRRTKR